MSGPFNEFDWVGKRNQPHITPETVAEWLSHLYSLDPNLVYALVNSRFPTNVYVADDEVSAVVDEVPTIAETEPQYQVGFLGSINGLLSYAGWDKRIGAVLGDPVDNGGRRLEGFCVVPVQKD